MVGRKAYQSLSDSHQVARIAVAQLASIKRHRKIYNDTDWYGDRYPSPKPQRDAIAEAQEPSPVKDLVAFHAAVMPE
jgi:hypothetical protein